MIILRRILQVTVLCATLQLCVSKAQAQIVFSNNFETDTAGFTSSGSLPALTRVSLPTDNVQVSVVLEPATLALAVLAGTACSAVVVTKKRNVIQKSR